MEQKFIVVKIEDIQESLNQFEVNTLASLLTKISDSRVGKGKSRFNEYMVINRDEPYAKEVEDILRANGHWEEG